MPFWDMLWHPIKLISMEATKLSMVYSKPPAPTQTECETLVSGIEKSILAMVSYYYSLPKSQGLTLRKELHTKVIQVVERVQNLVEIVSKYSGSERLQSTGLVWEETDDFDDLPKDNREAALFIIEQTTDLVKDALQEIEQALELGGEDDYLNDILDANEPRNNADEWSESDKTVISTGMGLIKTVKSTLKKTRDVIKTNGNCNCENNISQLDDICDYVKKLSCIVDEMTIVLYPPIVIPSVQTKVDLLDSSISSILQILKNSHVTSSGDEKWIEFLYKAKQHNLDKITEALTMNDHNL
ncbi:hypothetical protein LOTGIDRAFT_214465 [Lottia gigantea]|uniref:Cyclin-D1-binding protein 1 n=1 Tax=Lottia gigantea TaxID=225164 RepID=V4AIT1_LOTGI|nr:hypothetical protein LOTGIDRAFT_214465 [Lottia gigantea]ESO96922.1 hypothetical protein LOTGIDRAFT_214465 [Lottia gigantea]